MKTTKNGELQATDLTKLHELYDDERGTAKDSIRNRILDISSDIAARDKALAEVEKFKAQSMDVVINETKIRKSEIWSTPITWIAISVCVTVCVVASIAGVAWINGYWEYWSQR